MPFGAASLKKLAECAAPLQDVLTEAIKYQDFTIICAHRNKAAQDEAYKTGASKLKWPQSKHNTSPSCAVDIAPYIAELPESCRLLIGTPGQLDAIASVYKINRARASTILMRHYDVLAGCILTVAAQRGIAIRWGGNWDTDQNLFDQVGKLDDAPHFELA